MRSKFLFSAALCGILLCVVVMSSCAKDDNTDAKLDGVYSAVYSISGRVIAKEGETAIRGIRVEMLSEKGEMIKLDDPVNTDVTDNYGRFGVEVRSSNVKDEKLILKFTDPSDEYEDLELPLALQDVEFEDGDGLLFLGTYSDNVEVEMKLKGSGEDPAE